MCCNKPPPVFTEFISTLYHVHFYHKHKSLLNTFPLILWFSLSVFASFSVFPHHTILPCWLLPHFVHHSFLPSTLLICLICFTIIFFFPLFRGLLIILEKSSISHSLELHMHTHTYKLYNHDSVWFNPASEILSRAVS